jgi:hypothetical protein
MCEFQILSCLVTNVVFYDLKKYMTSGVPNRILRNTETELIKSGLSRENREEWDCYSWTEENKKKNIWQLETQMRIESEAFLLLSRSAAH